MQALQIVSHLWALIATMFTRDRTAPDSLLSLAADLASTPCLRHLSDQVVAPRHPLDTLLSALQHVISPQTRVQPRGVQYFWSALRYLTIVWPNNFAMPGMVRPALRGGLPPPPSEAPPGSVNAGDACLYATLPAVARARIGDSLHMSLLDMKVLQLCFEGIQQSKNQVRSCHCAQANAVCAG
jgi:hypothetical protein